MRVRVLITEFPYGMRTYKLGAELLIRDTDALPLLHGTVVEPVGRHAINLVAKQRAAAAATEQAHQTHLAEVAAEHHAVNLKNWKRAENGTL